MGNVTSKWSVIILDFVHYNTLQRIIMLTPDFRRFRDEQDNERSKNREVTGTEITCTLENCDLENRSRKEREEKTNMHD